jgi:hypothetical protein
MPMLCRAGVLVECCTTGVPRHDTSHETSGDVLNEGPSPCSGGCRCDEVDGGVSNDGRLSASSEQHERSEPRDCDSCAKSCDVVSLHVKPTDGNGVTVMSVAATVVARISCDVCLSQRRNSLGSSAVQIGQHIFIPPSERPFLI